MIESLLAESSVGEKLGVLNLSPYEGSLELATMKWHLDHPDRTITSLSVSTDMGLTAYTEKTVALAVMEAI